MSFDRTERSIGALVLLASAACATTAPVERAQVAPASNENNLFADDLPQEARVEWLDGGEMGSSGAVRPQIDGTRRRIKLVTSPGAAFFLVGGCPEDWEPDFHGADARQGKSGIIRTQRDLDMGTFTVTGEASSRPGATMRADIDCKKVDTSQRVQDVETLTASVESLGQRAGGAWGEAGARFSYRQDEPGDGVRSDRKEESQPDAQKAKHRAVIAAALTADIPMNGLPKAKPGVMGDVGYEFDGSRENWWKRFSLELRLQFAQVRGSVTTPEGEGSVTSKSILAQAIGRWSPRVADWLRFFVGAGVGVGHAQRLETAPDRHIPAKTGVVGDLEAGIAVGGDNLDVEVGWSANLSADEPFERHGGFAGFRVRFP